MLEILIDDERCRQGYSLRAFAKLTHIDRMTLRRRLANPSTFTLSEALQCCTVLEKALCQVIVLSPEEPALLPCLTPKE